MGQPTAQLVPGWTWSPRRQVAQSSHSCQVHPQPFISLVDSAFHSVMCYKHLWDYRCVHTWALQMQHFSLVISNNVKQLRRKQHTGRKRSNCSVSKLSVVWLLGMWKLLRLGSPFVLSIPTAAVLFGHPAHTARTISEFHSGKPTDEAVVWPPCEQPHAAFLPPGVTQTGWKKSACLSAVSTIEAWNSTHHMLWTKLHDQSPDAEVVSLFLMKHNCADE